MALFDLETSLDKERDGVPVVFADYESVRLTLARATNNDRLRLEIERVTRAVRGRVGPAVDVEREHATLLAFCRVCILKWETLLSTMRKAPGDQLLVPDADGYVVGIDMRGKLVPLTAENALAVFETRGLEGFRDQVLSESRNADHYRAREREADAGN